MADSSFGLDISERKLRIVDCAFRDKKIVIDQLGSADTTPFFFTTDNEKVREEMAQALTRLMASLKTAKKSVRVVIPDIYCYSQILTVPKLNEKELQSAIRYQADQFIPMPIEETALDLEILNEDPKTKKSIILIVATPKKLVSHIERTVELAGLYPESLENEFSVIRRLFLEEAPEPEDVSSLIINFAASYCSIYFFDKRTNTLVMKTVKIGLDLIQKDIMFNLNVDDKKALEMLKTIGLSPDGSVNLTTYIKPILKDLIDEINKFFLLANETYGKKIKRIQMFNYDSSIFYLHKTIEELFSVPTQPLLLSEYMAVVQKGPDLKNEITSYISSIAANYR